MFDFLWILFGELDGHGRFQPRAWNLSYPSGFVDIMALGDRLDVVTELWCPGDRMAYYPLMA